MKILSSTRRLIRVLGSKKPSVGAPPRASSSSSSHQCPFLNSFHHLPLSFQGKNLTGFARANYLAALQRLVHSKAYLSTEAAPVETKPTDAVQDTFDKILESINVKRTMAPNAWLWSLIANCQNQEDIKLLFEALQNLRRFRLSNLRIHDNFNSNLCREIVKACARTGAIDFGKKALWRHNVYGLTPGIGSANHLLSFAKDHNDAKLLVEVMKLMKKNDIPLLPSTADVVFSICYDLDDWELISKYSKRFIKGGVKLRKTAFDLWMDFAAKRGDAESLWKIEKLRSESMKDHTVKSGFACAKGLILDRKPEDAAAVIQVLNQTLSEAKRVGIVEELQKLVSEWPLSVAKYHEGENKKALVAVLKSDIPAMVACLLNKGLEVQVNLEDLIQKEIPC